MPKPSPYSIKIYGADYCFSYSIIYNGKEVARGAGYSSHRYALNAAKRDRKRLKNAKPD